MQSLRTDTPKEISGIDVIEFKDYKASCCLNTETGEKTVINLPKANVLSFGLNDGSTVIVRPSGTEPKIKIYVNAVGATEAEADKKREDLLDAGSVLLGF